MPRKNPEKKAAEKARKSMRRPIEPRNRNCRYCRAKVDVVDYKDLQSLKPNVTRKAKIRSAQQGGTCRRHQVQLSKAIKKARELGLLAYTGDNTYVKPGPRGRRNRED